MSQFHRSGSRTLGELWPEGSADVRRLDGAARLWWKAHDNMKLLGAAYAPHAEGRRIGIAHFKIS